MKVEVMSPTKREWEFVPIPAIGFGKFFSEHHIRGSIHKYTHTFLELGWLFWGLHFEWKRDNDTDSGN